MSGSARGGGFTRLPYLTNSTRKPYKSLATTIPHEIDLIFPYSHRKSPFMNASTTLMYSILHPLSVLVRVALRSLGSWERKGGVFNPDDSTSCSPQELLTPPGPREHLGAKNAMFTGAASPMVSLDTKPAQLSIY